MKTMFAIVFVIVFICPEFAYTWDQYITHNKFTEEAIYKSELKKVLINSLGISKGIDEIYQGDTILDIILEGARKEDKESRGLNHFYNPNKPAGENGLTDIFKKESNLDWAMGYELVNGEAKPIYQCEGDPKDFPTSNDCNDYSWRRARETFYAALTETALGTRNKTFYEFYKKLGQVLHLLQDMAVPAHTRNDLLSHHVKNPYKEIDDIDPPPDEDENKFIWLFFKKGNGNLFELWLKREEVTNAGYIAQKAQGAIIPSFASLEEYWDKDRTEGSIHPNDTLTLNDKERCGLAEYCNANFLSARTIFTQNFVTNHKYYFPYPTWASIEGDQPTYILDDDNKYEWVWYGNKVNEGENIDMFVRVKCIRDPFGNPEYGFFLDDKVHEAYAEKLIPKSVGYSAGLINYFFRGKLEISAPDELVYALIDGSVIEDGKTQQVFKEIKTKVKNITPKEKMDQGDIVSYEQMGQGQLIAVAKYKVRPNYKADLSVKLTLAEMENVEFSYSVSAPKTITSLGTEDPDTNEPKEYIFDFTENPIPVGITDLYLFVVFKGTLGNEKDIAVAVGMKDLMEPYHLSIVNTSDVFCIDGQIYTADVIRSTPSLRQKVDFDGDGIINECWEGEPYIDQHNEDRKVTIYSETGNQYTVNYTSLEPGRYGSIIMLLDETKLIYRTEIKKYTEPTSQVSDAMVSVEIHKSQLENGIFYINRTIPFRGIHQHWYTAKILWAGDMPSSLWYDTDAWPELENKEIVPMDPKE